MVQRELSREFGVASLTLTGVGTVVGAGIFVITGQAAAIHAGPAVALSFALASFVCLFSALCYAEMAAMVPLSGSGYSFANEAFGRNIAWIVGWALVAEYLFGTSAIAIGWSGYVQSVLADFGVVLPAAYASSPLSFDGATIAATGAVINVPAMLIVAAVTLSLLLGLKESVRFMAITVLIKLSAVALFVGFGLAYIEPANWTPFIPAIEARPGGGTAFGVNGIAAGAAMVFFAYLGFDALATTSQEAREPQRTVPLAIMGTLAITTVLYIAVALTMTGLANYRTLGTDAPIVTALQAAGSGLAWLKSYAGVAISIGLWAGIWGALFAFSRLLYRLASDGFLPARLALLSEKNRVPSGAVLLAGAMAIVVSGVLPIALLGELISTGTLLAFAVVCAGVISLRRREPDRPRPFRTPLWQFVAPAGIVTCIALLASMGSEAMLRVLAWQVAGGVLLLLFARGKRSVAD